MRCKFYLLLIGVLFGCGRESADKENQMSFALVSSDVSGINFTNKVSSTNDFNFLNYPYIYNGGGVAVGDIDNDGYEDIYFTSNQGSNKLYLNAGGLEFEDITTKAGVTDTGGWSTGTAMVDINNDGFLDIYVCKSGKFDNPLDRANKLYLNNGNKTFTEVARQWGLADTGFSTQAYFLDYDKDGDLDLYLVNHRPDFGNLRSTKTIIQEASDQLYRNDGTSFANVSKLANIQNKAWGLSAAIADFNNDSWPDIYVCNDFNEPDFLYINDTKGGFKDEILTRMDHIALNSMGSDISDFDNDGLLDLMVLDMSAEDHIRSKTNMPSMSTKAFEDAVRKGNHYQYMFNMLHWNRGNEQFSEIAQMAGIAKTDWSWASLFADFDNDGLKDVIITNGIKKDVGNVDFRNDLQNKIKSNQQLDLQTVLDMVPSTRLANHVFKNNGDLTFSKKDWGLQDPTFSNGAAYADFDNDGDLDLVINNLEDKSFLYENRSQQNYLQVVLKGGIDNRNAIGSRVTLFYGDSKQVQEAYLNRGYQSSVSKVLHFGLGELKQIEKLLVTWPDGKISTLRNVKSNQRKTISYAQSEENLFADSKENTFQFEEVAQEELGITYQHKEQLFNDYDKQLLLPYKLSQNGPYTAVSDVNGDGLEDIYMGGATSQPGELYMQQSDGSFTISKQLAFKTDSKHEDMQAIFFDFDNDNDNDLYVVSGGNEFDADSKMYVDRLYENNGKGLFLRTTKVLPENTSSGQTVAVSDIDKDGDLDIFLGGRHIPGKYPKSPKSTFLLNDKGVFKDVTEEIGFGNGEIGMVNDALFADYDNDGDPDLFMVGEWMSILIYTNTNGQFEKTTPEELKNTNGLWSSIDAEDIDKDGDVDFFLGNIGLNTKFKVDDEHSFQVYGNDFDGSGSFDVVLANNYKNRMVPIRGKECSSQQTPFISKKFASYNDFANATLTDIYGEKSIASAVRLEADLLESIFLENLGNGNFTIKKLPSEAQLSLITDFEFIDFDKDGRKEIIAVGNLYPVEVETTRFDASKGSILWFTNDELKSKPYSAHGYATNGDARRLKRIQTSKGEFLIVMRNDAKLQVFSIKE